MLCAARVVILAREFIFLRQISCPFTHQNNRVRFVARPIHSAFWISGEQTSVRRLEEQKLQRMKRADNTITAKCCAPKDNSMAMQSTGGQRGRRPFCPTQNKTCPHFGPQALENTPNSFLTSTDTPLPQTGQDRVVRPGAGDRRTTNTDLPTRFRQCPSQVFQYHCLNNHRVRLIFLLLMRNHVQLADNIFLKKQYTSNFFASIVPTDQMTSLSGFHPWGRGRPAKVSQISRIQQKLAKTGCYLYVDNCCAKM